MQFKVVKRGEASEKGLSFFYTGKVCKWGHKSPRYTNKGAREDCNPNARAGLCYRCVGLMNESGRIGKTFEELMETWDNTSEYENAVYLPLMSGTLRMGYKVVAKTLIDSCWWDSASKWLWVVDANSYVKSSLSKSNMERNGYAISNIKKSYLHLHRYVMGVSKEVPLMVDHVSGDRLDNRIVNLRLASIEDNSHNSRKHSKTLHSSFKGIFFDTNLPTGTKRWRASLYIGGKCYTKFEHCETSAAKAYDTLVRQYRKTSEFNLYNFPFKGERGLDGTLQ